MLNLNIGCDFSSEHIDTIESLLEYQNSKINRAKITSVYGSPKLGNPFGSTRPSNRETKVDKKTFIKNLKRLNDLGVKINITLNSLFPHIRNGKNSYDKNVFDSMHTEHELYAFVYDISPYVDNWILASPFLIEKFHKWNALSLHIIISTIMNVHSISQVLWIKNNWPRVTRICPALFNNRRMLWLAEANSIIPLELLTNEFCSLGGVECEGLYRQSCYLSQCMDVSWNPMKTCCIESRKKHPEAWLMARFILPQWMNIYRKQTGVDNFKITGRTHTAAYVNMIGKAYIDEKFEGNLLGLWGHLQATLNKNNWSKEQYLATDTINIPVAEIEQCIIHFINCTTDDCGIHCRKCKIKVDNILRSTNGEKC